MNVTTHQYGYISCNFVVIGVPLGGTITLDETWAPHVQAVLEVPYTLANYAACDPRLGGRAAFNVTRRRVGFPDQLRPFSLTPTGRSVDRARGVIRLEAASDEAILQRRKHLGSAPDESLLQWQRTDRLARRIVENYVGINQITAPWEYVPIPVRVDSQNLIPNPGFSVSTDGWTGVGCTIARTNSSLLLLSNPTSNGAYAFVGPASGSGQIFPGLSAGRTYTLSATIQVSGALGGTPSANARRLLVFQRRGSVILPDSLSPQAPTSNAITRLSVTFTVAEGVTEVGMRAYHGHTSGNIWWDSFTLVEHVPGDPTEGTYWDGDTPDDDQYFYDWDGTAGVSTSTRIAVAERSPDAFIIEPGENYWDGPASLFQSAGLRLFSTDNQVWKLINESYVAPGAVRLLWDDITEWSDEIDLANEDDDWCDAAVVRYVWRDWRGNDREMFDTYGPASPVKVRTVEVNRPYPGPGLAQNIVRRAAGYLDAVTFTAVADWNVTPTQPIAITQPDGTVLSGVVRRVTFNLDDDTMTVTTRGLTLPPLDSWTALPAGQRWTDSPVGASWIGEVIG